MALTVISWSSEIDRLKGTVMGELNINKSASLQVRAGNIGVLDLNSETISTNRDGFVGEDLSRALRLRGVPLCQGIARPDPDGPAGIHGDRDFEILRPNYSTLSDDQIVGAVAHQLIGGEVALGTSLNIEGHPYRLVGFSMRANDGKAILNDEFDLRSVTLANAHDFFDER